MKSCKFLSLKLIQGWIKPRWVFSKRNVMKTTVLKMETYPLILKMKGVFEAADIQCNAHTISRGVCSCVQK
jgi:hypothetical protein